MKKIFVYTMGLLFTQATMAQHHTPIMPEQPAAGRDTTFTVNLSGAALAGHPRLYAIVNTEAKQTHLSTDTLTLTAAGKNTYRFTITLPDAAVLLIASIYDGKDTDDNNGQEYILPVMAGGKAKPYAWYRLSQLMLGVGGGKKDITAAARYMQQEIDNNPAAEDEFRQQYFNMLINSPEPAHKALLIKKLLAYNTSDEQELTIHQQYLEYLQQKKAADSLGQLLEQRFPNGTYVQRQQMNAIKKATSWQEQQQLFQQFITRFPEPAGQPDYEYNALYKTMIQRAAAAGDSIAIPQYIARIHNNADKVSAYVSVAASLPQQAMYWTQQGIAATDTSQAHVNWEAYTNAAKLYLQQHRFSAAKTLAGIVYAHTKNKESVLLMAQTNAAAGDSIPALHILETAVTSGQSSTYIKQLLQEIYTSKYPGADFNAYYQKLQPTTLTSDHTREIQAATLNEKIAGIVIKDINGKKLDIASLKGKTVVLDFWATWCKPCIQSFPAMQQVMQQHPEVVFLFIATFETGDALQKVKSFAKEKNFPFRYYVDEKADSGPGFKAFNQYKVSSVPYKVILDKAGVVRFRTNGFDGNDDALINELNTMIRLLQ